MRHAFTFRRFPAAPSPGDPTRSASSRRPFGPAAILPLVALLACGPPEEAPDLSASLPADTPYPRLLPLDEVLASPPARIGPDGALGDRGRAERLRARAAALGGTVIAEADRDRLRDAGNDQVPPGD